MTLPAERLRPLPAQPSLNGTDRCPPETRALLQVILPVAAHRFGVSMDDLVGPRRFPRLVQARAFVVWALRSLGRPVGYTPIGELLGGRDHTSAIYLHEKAIWLRLHEPEFAAACTAIAAGYAYLEEAHRGYTQH